MSEGLQKKDTVTSTVDNNEACVQPPNHFAIDRVRHDTEFTSMQMRRFLTLLLQFVIVLIGVSVLVFLLWEPHVEGVNKNATVFEIYFKDPFLAFVYFSSIPFFVGLYQSFKLLGLVRQNQLFSQASIAAVRVIKYCAIVMIGLVVVSVIFMLSGDPEDRPPGVVIRLFVITPSIIVAVLAAKFGKKYRNIVNIISEKNK